MAHIECWLGIQGSTDHCSTDGGIFIQGSIDHCSPDGGSTMFQGGAQWLSGRVLDSRPKGSGFEPHWRHCVVVLEQDTFILA